MINCVMNTGGPFSGTLADILYATAKKMMLAHKKSQKFKCDDGFGVIGTAWEYGTMGTITGIQFKAEVETPKGESVIVFIVQSAYVDDDYDNPWVRAKDDEALARIVAQDAMDERPSRRKLH